MLKVLSSLCEITYVRSRNIKMPYTSAYFINNINLF